ncbi:MAG: hypothetical protein U5Q03_14945 [Bacteroidota bacterium]|nr:hypothetical protein [Bacteroidota bacterium]
MADKGVDFYICAGCGEQVAFENAWLTIPYSKAGKQMMQGYIHCRACTKKTDAFLAWKLAHDKENPHKGHAD